MEFGFFLKKAMGVLLAPVPLCLTLVAVGWYLHVRKRRKAGKTFQVLGVTGLLVLSMPITSQFLIKPFEFHYSKVPVDEKSALEQLNFSHVVVLGCWHNDDDKLPLVAKVHPCSMARIIQATQIWHTLPETKLIFTGFQGKSGQPSHPEVNALLAQSLGVPKTSITVLTGANDTEEEIELLKDHVKDGKLLVISSASHLIRVDYLFSRQNMQVILSPAEYLSSHGNVSWRQFVPDSYALAQSERAFYEALGNIWVRLKALF